MNLTYTTPSVPLAWLLNNAEMTKGTIYSTIGSNPKLFSANENITNYIFNMTETGSPASTRLVLNIFGSVSLNGSIVLGNSFMSVILRPSDTPNSNEFYRAGGSTTAANRSLIAESIAFELRNNLTFNQYYNVWAQGATVIIEARVSGTAYNFNLVALATNLTIMGGTSYTNSDGADNYLWQGLIDYNTFVEVYVANGVYGQTIDRRNSYLTDIFNITGMNQDSFAINVSDSIKHYTDVVLPTKRPTPVIVMKELDKQVNTNGEPILPVVRPYFLTWGFERRFAAGLEKKKSITGQSAIRYTLNGAFGLLENYDFNPYILDTTSTFATKFMTSSPKNKETDYDSHEYIHFYRRYNQFELGNFGIEVEFFFYDGTSVTQSYPFTSHSTTNGTISVDVSPSTLSIQNIEAVNAKQVDYYKLKLYWTISSTQRYYSEERIYTIKRICNKKVNNVIFLNEFGVFDSINFTSETDKRVTREVEYLQRPIGINTPNTGFDTISDEVSIPINMTGKDTYTITTELIDNDTYNWLSRILNSSAIFIYSEEDSRYRAINIEQYDYLYNSAANNGKFSMTFSYTVNNNYISR